MHHNGPTRNAARDSKPDRKGVIARVIPPTDVESCTPLVQTGERPILLGSHSPCSKRLVHLYGQIAAFMTLGFTRGKQAALCHHFCLTKFEADPSVSPGIARAYRPLARADAAACANARRTSPEQDRQPRNTRKRSRPLLSCFAYFACFAVHVSGPHSRREGAGDSRHISIAKWSPLARVRTTPQRWDRNPRLDTRNPFSTPAAGP